MHAGLSQARRVEIRAPSPVRAYVGRLAESLHRRGHAVRIVADGFAPAMLDWLLYFERLTSRRACPLFELLASITPRDFADAPDVIIDLTSAGASHDVPTIRMMWEEAAGEVGLIGSAFTTRTPTLLIFVTVGETDRRRLRQARLAVEDPTSLNRALQELAARSVTLLSLAVDDIDGGTRNDSGARHLSPADWLPMATSAFTNLTRRLTRRMDALLRHPDHWRIAIRTVGDGEGVMETLGWSGPSWHTLPDDGGRYYADPFPLELNGRRWLFCEEFPYATGKGILSVAAIDDRGEVGTPRPFLETASHLSWPQVFEHGGSIWMIPESVGAGRVELWRCIEFPFRWELDRVLIEGVRAHDALVHFGASDVFLLATLDDDGGSSWDALGLFHAPSLFGPWAAHPRNPLLVDVSCARPGGPFVQRGHELWRPAQDCRGGYGAGVALCRVTQLDCEGYAQEVVMHLGLPPIAGAQGAHTLVRLGNLEAIDWRGPAHKHSGA